MTRTRLALLLASVLLIVATSCEKHKENKVPVADAGPNKAVTLPIASETFTGTGTDEDGDVVAYLWSQVSGPSATTIMNPGSPSTAINGFVAGTYIFQLMVTDNMGATGVDTTKIVVTPSPIQTVTFQPSNNPTEVLIGVNNGQNWSGPGQTDMCLAAWTINNNPYTTRQLLKFDLSSIPASATIISATLSLSSYPPPTLNGNFQDANFGPTNALILSQVMTNWAPNTVGWFTQPTYNASNQIIIAHTTSSQLDLNIDVKNQLQSMVSSNANYGWGIRLQTEATYNCRLFVSSSAAAALQSKRPKLVVTYQ